MNSRKQTKGTVSQSLKNYLFYVFVCEFVRAVHIQLFCTQNKIVSLINDKVDKRS